MGCKVKLQIMRKGSKHESYRICLPKSLVQVHSLRDKDFHLVMKKGDLVLKPVEKLFTEK